MKKSGGGFDPDLAWLGVVDLHTMSGQAQYACKVCKLSSALACALHAECAVHNQLQLWTQQSTRTLCSSC